MSAVTLEQMNAMGSGQQVEVRVANQQPQVWTKQGALWERDGLTVVAGNFTGAVGAGLVFNPATDPAVGTVFRTDSERVYCVLRVREPHTQGAEAWLDLAEFASDGAYRAMTECRASFPATRQWVATTDHGLNMAVVNLCQALLAERTAAQQRAEEAHATPATALPTTLVQELQAWANQVEDTEFDDLLERHGIELPTKDIVVTARLHGTTSWTPEMYEARDFIGGDFTVQDVEDSVTISWERTVRVTVQSRRCQCGEDMDRGLFEDLIPENYDEWDYEVLRCSED